MASSCCEDGPVASSCCEDGYMLISWGESGCMLREIERVSRRISAQQRCSLRGWFHVRLNAEVQMYSQ